MSAFRNKTPMITGGTGRFGNAAPVCVRRELAKDGWL